MSIKNINVICQACGTPQRMASIDNDSGYVQVIAIPCDSCMQEAHTRGWRGAAAYALAHIGEGPFIIRPIKEGGDDTP